MRSEAPISDETTRRLHTHYRLMMRIRALEEMALRGAKEGVVLGSIHPSIGQEAVAVGVVANLLPSDFLLSTHRGHGHTLAKGASSLAMIQELLGRRDGTCRGKGGSMHIADFSIGMLGANGVVAANIVIATGAAHGIKLRGGDNIVCCFFGDGAVNRGPFLEGLNWAAVFGLPVLFVCEDNGYAATTASSTTTSGEGPSARARSLGLPAIEVDGNDVLAVDVAAAGLIRKIKSGEGPQFLHAKTYRLTGHTAADLATYRSADEVEARRRINPVVRARSLLEQQGLRPEDLDRDDAAALREMEDAFATALASPFPSRESAFEDVQDSGDPRIEAY